MNSTWIPLSSASPVEEMDPARKDIQIDSDHTISSYGDSTSEPEPESESESFAWDEADSLSSLSSGSHASPRHVCRLFMVASSRDEERSSEDDSLSSDDEDTGEIPSVEHDIRIGSVDDDVPRLTSSSHGVFSRRHSFALASDLHACRGEVEGYKAKPAPLPSCSDDAFEWGGFPRAFRSPFSMSRIPFARTDILSSIPDEKRGLRIVNLKGMEAKDGDVDSVDSSTLSMEWERVRCATQIYFLLVFRRVCIEEEEEN